MRKVFIAEQKTTFGRRRIQLYDCRCNGNVDRETEKKQKRFFSGKKKRQTLKSQIIICEESEEIIATFFGKGKTHDAKIYEKSGRLSKEIEIKADSGYQGLQKKHGKVLIPKKNSKLKKLTKEEKRANRELARKRVKVENVIRRLKIFRILGERYRNRRKRLGLRFNLISGIYNTNSK
jgi:hypothetical protein